MAEFMKEDIFFFVTTIAVVTFTVTLVVLMVYLIGVMRNVRDISDIVKIESKNISQDISELRATIKREGMRWKHLTDFLRKPNKRTKK